MSRLPFHSLVSRSRWRSRAAATSRRPRRRRRTCSSSRRSRATCPVVSEWLGTTEGSVDAQIRAQVAGYLVSRDYQEGQRVEVGDLLFKIDPRAARAALEQAEGDLGRAQSELELARLDVARYTPLVEEGAVSRQEFDNAVARQRSAEAQRAGRARRRRTRRRSSSASPRSARRSRASSASRRRSSATSSGRRDPNPLTSVSQLDPIRVSFPLSEQEYLYFAPRFQQALDDHRFRARRAPADPRRRQRVPAPRHRLPGRSRDRSAHGHDHGEGRVPEPRPRAASRALRARARRDRLSSAARSSCPQRALQDLQGSAQLAVVKPDDTVDLRIGPEGRGVGHAPGREAGVAAGRARDRRGLPEGAARHEGGAEARARPSSPARRRPRARPLRS